MTSPKGLSCPIRRNPPVPHLRRLSCTRPSSGRRNTSHGSHMERGMTLTPPNSCSAFLGRSPPRMVMVNLTNSPRRSSPACASASATMEANRGFDATTTFAPGTNFGSKMRPQRKKNVASPSSPLRFKTVNRGNGALRFPSNDGGKRHTPPRPARSLANSPGVYSWIPYGGSVTTAWMEQSGWRSSHVKQSPKYSSAFPKQNGLGNDGDSDSATHWGETSATYSAETVGTV